MSTSRRGLWLLILLFGVGCNSNYAAATFIAPRQDGDSDSDSDSDSGSESDSCSNGVCTVCHNKVCTTTTRGLKATSISSNSANTDPSRTRGDHRFTETTAHSTTATDPHGSGTSANASATNTSTSNTAKHGLSTGGIIGLVIGLLILAGLLAMMILKRRDQTRHKRKRPKGTTLLTADTPTNALFNIGNERSDSEMAESTFSPGVAHSATDGILAANANHSGRPVPQPYNPSNSAVAVRTHSDHSRPGPSNEINPILLSEVSSSSLPSPHEPGFEPVQSDSAAGPSVTNPQSRSLPGLPSSTMHADLVAFQKDLERDHEKRNRPSGAGDTEASDPPPLYSVRG